MVKMVKNRVTPSRNPAPSSTAITSDPFFSTNTRATSKKENRPSTSRDRFFGKEKIQQRKEFKKPDLDSRSKNIKKAKNVRNEANKFNFKNKDGTIPTKYNQNKTKIKNSKVMPKIENKRQEKFKQIEEDAEFKLQAKNKCRDVVKYEGKEEKVFDKKKWRLQKYSKKYKLEQFEEKRKKAVLKEYYQQTKGESPKIDIKKIYEQYDSDEEETKPRKNYVQNPDYKPPEKTQTKNKTSTKRKVQLELERLKQEKEAKKEEFLKRKQEKEEALKVYKQKKNEKQKQLHKKTKRGQPVMKGRIEMLLEKIQNG